MEEPSSTSDETGIHVIIKGDLHDVELFPEFIDLSGCAVVEHKEGYVQKERPHFHVWIPYINPTKKTEREYKDRLRAYYDTKISGLNWNRNANAYYCVKAHDSYKNWLEYVARDATVKIASWIKWNRHGDPPPIVTTTNVICLPDTTQKTVSQQKKAAAHIRFYEWCQKQEIQDELTIQEIQEYWIEWTQGAYELRNVSAPIRYVWYMLQTDKKSAKERLVREMSRKIFSDF